VWDEVKIFRLYSSAVHEIIAICFTNTVNCFSDRSVDTRDHFRWFKNRKIANPESSTEAPEPLSVFHPLGRNDGVRL
jgi:hypothetical protein